MDSFKKLNKIRNDSGRKYDTISNVSEVEGESGFRCLHVLWLYPDALNIHGGRGDILGILNISTIMGLPVEIRRCDSLRQDIDWEWPHLIYMTAGELKCAPEVISALRKQSEGLDSFISKGGFLVANGSSGAVLADSLEFNDGRKVQGLGFIAMDWKERDTVWGDDIWIKTPEGLDVIGNQIQVADVMLKEGQEPLGTIEYGRGNCDVYETGEGARAGNVIYTGILGPLLTKNPLFTASILKEAAALAGIDVDADLDPEDIEFELKSAECIKTFMKAKMGE